MCCVPCARLPGWWLHDSCCLVKQAGQSGESRREWATAVLEALRSQNKLPGLGQNGQAARPTGTSWGGAGSGAPLPAKPFLPFAAAAARGHAQLRVSCMSQHAQCCLCFPMRGPTAEQHVMPACVSRCGRRAQQHEQRGQAAHGAVPGIRAALPQHREHRQRHQQRRQPRAQQIRYMLWPGSLTGRHRSKPFPVVAAYSIPYFAKQISTGCFCIQLLDCCII